MWSPYGRFAAGFADVGWAREGEGPSIAGRLFYPAAKEASARCGSGCAAWLQPWRWRLPGVPWLWDVNYARGLTRFMCFRLRGWLHGALKLAMLAFTVAVGKTQRMALRPGAPLATDAPEQLPLVIFSHGMGASCILYSVICSELASQGYLVLALDHNDGTASAARLPGHRGWRFYAGLGDSAAQVAKTRVRVSEMRAALQLVQAMHRGDKLPGAEMSLGLDPSSFLKGRVDLRCVAAAGHSYGGATTAALVAEEPLFRCGVCLDPWWHALYPETKALERFATRAPLLIVGSHDWNVPNAWGQLSCGGERQERVLAAAAARHDGGQRTGGGAMLLCIAGSSHNTFADALPLFGQKTGWLLERLGLTARLDPVLGIHLCMTALLQFLSLHLPLSPAQRAAQTWEPAKGHSGLDAIKERDAADALGSRSPRGPLSRLFPGRGLLVGLSDMLMDRLMPHPSAFRQVTPGPWPSETTTGGSKQAQQGQQAAQGLAAEPAGKSADGASDDASGGGQQEWAVATALEAAEAALPSSDPASGPHPHAPSAAVGAPPLTAGLPPPLPLGGLAQPLSEALREELRRDVNTRYADAVEAGEVEAMHALLGSEHIFKCITV